MDRFFRRISTGFELSQCSWQVLREAKSLMVFPILSGISCLLILASFAVPFVMHPQWLDFLGNQGADGTQVPPWAYVVAFVFYFCNYFVVIFFNAALISCALVGFHGGTPTVASGLQAAAARLPQILAWAFVAATVGVLLKVVENAHRRVGSIIRAILGTVWTVCTYFVVPVLVVEKVGPFKAIRRSMSILRKTWGEGLSGEAGLRFMLFLLALPGLALVLLGVLAMGTAPLAGVALFALAGVYYLSLTVVGSALDGILLAALYLYAAYGEVPDAFRRSRLKGAFASAD